MTSQPETQSESLVAKLARMGITSVATAGVGSTMATGLDGAFPGADPVDVTGMHGTQIDSGSVMHHGPAAGGELLDRPSAGYMAHASTTNGVEVEHGLDVSTIARDIDKAGTFSAGGHDISVLDYMPGGDVVQMAAGNVNPSQLAMMALSHGMSREMNADDGGSLSMVDGKNEGVTGSQTGSDGMRADGNGVADQRGGAMDQAGSAGDAPRQRFDANGVRIPDADENARDMEALAIAHRLDLDTAVETSDQQTVRSEIHAHGRTLEIETNFEATAPDNAEERAEASEHVEDVVHSAVNEMEHTRPDMRFRSKVMAHLDAASKDEGMTI